MTTEAQLSQVRLKFKQKTDSMDGALSTTLNTFKEKLKKSFVRVVAVLLVHFVLVHCAQHNQFSPTALTP